MTRIFISTLIIFFGAAANAESIFKWVDEQGVTHYSSGAPPAKKAEQIKAPTAPVTGEKESDQPGMKNWIADEKLKKLKKNREEQEAAENKENSARSQRCAEARRRLGILQQQVPVYSTNDKGEREFFDNKSREEEANRMKEAIKDNC